MPIYEFICESCSNEFEQIQSFSQSRMPACPRCGSAHVGRRMSRPAIHFKGSGWYITDSKKSSENKSGESSKESTKGDSAGESKTETKTESKTESTSDAKSETKSTSSSESKSAATSVASD